MTKELLEVQLENFITHKLTKVSFKNFGSYYIYSKRNGDGKSLILDAICWGLTGNTIRGGNADDVIGYFAKCCRVIQIWKDHKRFIKIERYRKHPKFKNRVLIFFSKDGKSWNEDLSKETSTDTDLFISKLFGIDYSTFLSAVTITKPKSDLNFCESRDVARKEVMTKLLNLNWIDKSLDKAKKDRRIKEDKFNRLSMLRNNYKNKLESFNNLFKSIKKESNNFEKDNQLEIDKLKKKLKFNVENIPIEHINLLKNNIKKWEKILSQKEKIKNKIDNKYTKLEIKSGVKIDTLMQLKEDKFKEIQLIEKKIITYKSKPSSGICNECGSKYNSDNISLLINKMNKLKKSLKLIYDNCSKEMQEIKLEDKRNNRVFEARLSTLNVSIDVCENKLNNFRNKLEKYRSVREQYKFEKSRILEVKNRIEELKQKKNPWPIKLRKLKFKIKKYQKKNIKLIGGLREIKEALSDLSYAIEAFGNSGIKNDIISSKISQFENKINYYLGKLTDHNITVKLDNKVKHGSIEKIEIYIQDDRKRKPLAYEQWSGGERTLIRFAIEWAKNSLSETEVNLTIIDEGFDYLDPIAIKRIMDVMTQESDKKIICISNLPGMQNIFKNSIKVKSENGQSRIYQAN